MTDDPREVTVNHVFRMDLDSAKHRDIRPGFSGTWDEENRSILTDPENLPADLSGGDYLSFEAEDFPDVGRVLDHGTTGSRAYVQVEFL